MRTKEMHPKQQWKRWIVAGMVVLAGGLAKAAEAPKPVAERGRFGERQTEPGPFDRQVNEQELRLATGQPPVQARAAEALGFLRAYRAEPVLIQHLQEGATEVRRQAALALAWCGSRVAVSSLLEALADPDWFVRQSAHVALVNLTGMEFPFNALATPIERMSQARPWQSWWDCAAHPRPSNRVSSARA